MTPIYHLLGGFTLSKIATGHFAPEIIIAAVLPDILGTVPMVVDKVVDSIRFPEGNVIKKFKKDLLGTTFLKPIDKFMYRITHSFTALTVFGILFYLYFPDSYLVMTFAYFLHLAVDVPTHSKEWATRLFYPFSDFHIDGYNWWENKTVSLIFWLVLAVIAFKVFYL